jgi:hypothetical protein
LFRFVCLLAHLFDKFHSHFGQEIITAQDLYDGFDLKKNGVIQPNCK